MARPERRFWNSGSRGVHGLSAVMGLDSACLPNGHWAKSRREALFALLRTRSSPMHALLCLGRKTETAGKIVEAWIAVEGMEAGHDLEPEKPAITFGVALLR
jgi:hypothetical protein